ncbi:MAG TPA: polysaccharide lyase [Chitinophagaceae bacterium]
MSGSIIVLKFLFLPVALFAACTVAFAQRQNLLLETTFENGNYLSGWSNYQHCCDYSVQQTQEQVKAGSKALRLEIRKTDPQTSGSIRSEITQPNDPLNQDRWYGFSMYLKDWSDDDAGECVFQWHPDNLTGTATAALWTTGGRFTYVTNSGGTAPNEYTDIGPVLSNQWVDFVIHTRWTTDSTGLLQVWMKGNLMINRTGIKTASDAPYFKLGINKFGWGIQPSTTTLRILYFDEVRIGNASATYNDVAPFLPRRDYFRGL